VNNRDGAIISIRPRFAAAIFSGEKTVELRTRTPRLTVGATLLIYVTTPVAELQGLAKVAFVETGTPSEIWQRFGSRAAIDRQEFDTYTDDRISVSAIGLSNIERFPVPKSLVSLRLEIDGFQPPQFMAFLDRPKFHFLSRLVSEKRQKHHTAAAE
jgi:predicted transcriptional regulator